jgi:hypothetical protein
MAGDDEPEHRVAEELEALVGLPAGVLGAPGPVAEGLQEQLFVAHDPAEAFGESPPGFAGVAGGRGLGAQVLPYEACNLAMT